MSTKLKRCRVCGFRFSPPHPKQSMCHVCIKLSNQAKRDHGGARWGTIARAARKIHQQRILQTGAAICDAGIISEANQSTSNLHNNRPERAQP
jgi:hypothetical protein